jgi:uncharacterized membrane protein
MPTDGLPRRVCPSFMIVAKLSRSPILGELALLSVASLTTAGLVFVNGPLILRVPLGMFALLLIPGYVLTTVAFPHTGDLDGIERLAASFGLSVASVIALSLVMNYLPWGLRPEIMVGTLTAWNLGLALVGALRRIRLPSDERFQIEWNLTPVGRMTHRATLAGLSLTAAMVTAASSLLVVVAVPPADATEFYVLGPQGLAQDFPRIVRVGDAVVLELGIKNAHESPTQYEVEVSADGEHMTLSSPLALAPGEARRLPISFQFSRPGENREVVLSLLRNGERTSYRFLRLWMDVLPLSSPVNSGSAASRQSVLSLPVPGMGVPEPNRLDVEAETVSKA